MNPKKKNNWLLSFFISCFLFSGCGYHLVGTGNTLPPHLKTIYISVFQNTSSQPEIHRELTSAVLQSFISDGRLKVARKDNANLVMDATLNYYKLRNVSFGSQDLVSNIIIELGVKLKVTDQVKNKIFIEQELKTQWDYKSTSDVATTERARLEALDLAFEDLGRRLVSLIVDQF
jgi:outer membrane lipopolysaccharide assembly protein LptE/RlpB